MNNFYNLSRKDLEAWLGAAGFFRGHSATLFQNAYRSLSCSPFQGFGLPAKLSRLGQHSFECKVPIIHSCKVSTYDAAVKFLFRLEDGLLIESVLMPEKSRITLCVSSQVGCRQACRFCQTGRMGLMRNLETGEIIGQIVAANRWLSENPAWKMRVRLANHLMVTNLVFMGMGEPLDNVERVCKSLEIMLDHHGLSLAPRRVTVSTAGHLDGLKILVNKNFGTGLAFSLHETDQRQRSWLMPLNRRYPLARVLAFLKAYCEKTGKHILIQYTVIDGVNDSKDHAKKLIECLHGIRSKINLIPLNPVNTSTLAPPDASRLQAFQSILAQSGLRSLIRFSKGQDILAACGQLVSDR